MVGHKICSYGEIWPVIPELFVNPSYMKHCEGCMNTECSVESVLLSIKCQILV